MPSVVRVSFAAIELRPLASQDVGVSDLHDVWAVGGFRCFDRAIFARADLGPSKVVAIECGRGAV